MELLYKKIAGIGEKLGAKEMILYGSRARGDNRRNSDIDIAVFGMPLENQSIFRDRIDDLDTLLEVDILFVKPATDSGIMANVIQEGRIIMKRTTKLENFIKAVSRLEEAVNGYSENSSDVYRDGVIQRFEFTAELAWKACREHLLNLQYTDINSPKATMKKAFSEGIIKDEKGWLDLLQDRNQTSHMYDDTVAEEIFEHICKRYIFMLEDLTQALQL